MSVRPSIFVKSLRTEAAQPPQTIFGTLSDTKSPSVTPDGEGAAGTTAGADGVSTETGSASVAQPAMDAMTLLVNSIGTNLFTVILPKNKEQHLHTVRVDQHSDACRKDD